MDDESSFDTVRQTRCQSGAPFLRTEKGPKPLEHWFETWSNSTSRSLSRQDKSTALGFSCSPGKRSDTEAETSLGFQGVQLLSATSQILGESLRAAPCWTILFRFHRRRGGEAISWSLRGDCFGRSVGSVIPSLADGRPSRPRNDMPVVHRSWLVTTTEHYWGEHSQLRLWKRGLLPVREGTRQVQGLLSSRVPLPSQGRGQGRGPQDPPLPHRAARQRIPHCSWKLRCSAKGPPPPWGPVENLPKASIINSIRANL